MEFEKIDLIHFSKEKTAVRIYLKIKNENFFPIPIDTLEYRILLDDLLVYEGKNDSIVELPARSEGVYGFLLEFRNENFASNAAHLKKHGGIRYRVEGTAKFSVFSKDFLAEGQILIPLVSVGEMNFSELSLNNATVDLFVEVFNPNQFAIEFNSAEASLILGEAEVASARLNNSNGIAPETAKTFKIPVSVSPARLWDALKKFAGKRQIRVVAAIRVDFGFVKKSWRVERVIDRNEIPASGLGDLLLKLP